MAQESGRRRAEQHRHKEHARRPRPLSLKPDRVRRGPAAGAHRALRQDEATTDLLDAVLARDNLTRAWQRVKANKGASGIDGVTLEDFPAHAREHWPAWREQIEHGRYRPQAVRRVEIPKRNGGTRRLGIPTVGDRVIQQAIAQVLTPIFDPSFSASSFGFRPGRNAHQAIRQVQRFVKDGWRIAVDIDLWPSSSTASITTC